MLLKWSIILLALLKQTIMLQIMANFHNKLLVSNRLRVTRPKKIILPDDALGTSLQR